MQNINKLNKKIKKLTKRVRQQEEKAKSLGLLEKIEKIAKELGVKRELFVEGVNCADQPSRWEGFQYTFEDDYIGIIFTRAPLGNPEYMIYSNSKTKLKGPLVFEAMKDFVCGIDKKGNPYGTGPVPYIRVRKFLEGEWQKYFDTLYADVKSGLYHKKKEIAKKEKKLREEANRLEKLAKAHFGIRL